MATTRHYWYLTHPLAVITRITKFIPRMIISDKLYIKCFYYTSFGKFPNINNPQSFNEKLQWLKLYDRRPEYTKMVDKHEVKKFVEEKIGKDHVIPTLAVYDKVEDINYDSLPNQFVLKCTHDSGGLVICKDKETLNRRIVEKKLKKNLSTNIFWRTREWPYKNVHPRIIAEKYMTDESGTELKDYKFFCFSGKVKMFKIDFNRFVEHHANYYDREGNMLSLGEKMCPPDPTRNICIPDNLQEMIRLAEILSENIPFVRIDLYNVNGHIYFGEITFFPDSGVGVLNSEEWDLKLGSYITLHKN